MPALIKMINTMSLTKVDLHSIRDIVHEAIQTEVPPMIRKEMSLQLDPVDGRLRDIDDRLANVEGRLEAVENDIEEIYFMLSKPSLAT